MRNSKSTSNTPLILALTFVAGAAASCARIEADVSDAQVTKKAVNFQGIPGGANLGEVSTTQSFTLTSDDLSWAKNMNAEVYAYAVEFKAVGAVQDLSFIHYARITMSDGAADSTTPAVEIINYQRPDHVVASPLLSVKTTYPIDVTKLWVSKTIVVTMQLAGVFPDETWSADVTLDLGGKISYKL
jgi:hypothetical protein